MKQFVVLSLLGLCLVGSAYGRPKFLLIPIDDVEFVNEMPWQYTQPLISREARSAYPEEPPVAPPAGAPQYRQVPAGPVPPPNRRQLGGPPPEAAGQPFFTIPEGQRALADD